MRKHLNIDALRGTDKLVDWVAEPATAPIFLLRMTNENLCYGLRPCKSDDSLDRVLSFKNVNPRAGITRDL